MIEIEDLVEEFELTEDMVPTVLDLLEFLETHLRLNGQIKHSQLLEEMIAEIKD